MELIARAPWREAVTYRDTWPHEFVVVKKDGQQELLAAFHHRISRGEGVECRFFHRTQKYLFLGEYKYWALQDSDETILNRALLYKDRRDFVIREGDTGVAVESNVSAEETELASDEGVSVARGPEGRIEALDIREIWADEAADFTPWLAENLDLLGEFLGLDLELVEVEKAVGSFSLDILAKESKEGYPVAIENQLESTDHNHLGQLLTYAVGCDAEAVIWIATWFRPEHKAVIDRLNQWAEGKVWFLGVKVGVIKIDDSPPAPVFLLDVFPEDYWN